MSQEVKLFEVIVSTEAYEDIVSIYNYISIDLDSTESALRLLRKLIEAIESLAVFPYRFKIIDTPPPNIKELRAFIVKGYAILFIINVDEIRALGVTYRIANIHNKLHSR